MLVVRDLEVRYGELTALAGVELTVGDGEIVSVLGPSGSGKSTLLRAVAGLEEPTRGSIAWDRRDFAGIPPHRRQVGLMFQDHALFQHRDVLGNVLFGLRMQRMPRAWAEQRASEMLDLVGLSGFEHRKVAQLSGGEQQRVALARALAPAPRLLMLDEPLGSLDRPLRERLMIELRELLTRLGLTALYVTHDHDEAFALGDRVAVMHAGTIEQVGTPPEVWQRPATEFVARFLGYTITEALGTGRVGVRPDGLRLVDEDGVAGVVVARAFRRDHFLLQVKVADLEPLPVAVTGATVPEIGESVQVQADPGTLVPFGARPVDGG